MAKKQQYASVAELVHATAPHEEFKQAFDEAVEQRKLIERLLVLRAKRGLSQKDIAERMNCTQSRVSKLENAIDGDVRLGDLRAYADAVGCDLIACPIPHDMEPVEMVKCHTITIKKHTDDLAELARTDEAIAEGVASFFIELLANFMWMLGDSAKRLPTRPDGTPRLRVEARFEVGTDDDPDAPCCPEPSRLLEATP